MESGRYAYHQPNSVSASDAETAVGGVASGLSNQSQSGDKSVGHAAPEESGAGAHPAEPEHWFAMRVTYQREMAVRDVLDMQGFTTYLPMRYQLRVIAGKRKRICVPAIRNLLFVRSSKDRLQRVKAKLPHLQYMTSKIEGRNQPIVVPDYQMRDFIAVTSAESRDYKFYAPAELQAPRGAHVRLHGGPLDGVEGHFVRLKGRRNKRVLVELDSVVSVVVEVVGTDFIEIIG